MFPRIETESLYSRNGALAYATAVAAVGAAYSLYLLIPALTATPLASFLLAVAAVAAYWGYGPALLAAVLSTAAACWLVLPSLLTLPGVLWALGVFLTVALIVAGVSHARRKAEGVRIAAEDALRHWQELVEGSGDVVLGRDLNGTVTAWNRAATRLFGYSAEEIVGTSALCLVPEDRLEEFERILARLRRGECLSSEETERLTRDGRRIWISVTSVPILGPDGRIVGASMVCHDINARKRAEEALRESENKFSILFSKASIPAVLSRFPDHRFVDVNDAWVELFGYSREELIGKTSLELGINRNVALREDTIRALQRHTPVRNLEQTLFSRSGDPHTVLTSVDVVEIGAECFALTSLNDITERKQAEEALRKSEARLRAFQETSLDGFVVFKAVREGGRIVDLEYTYVNPTAERIVGKGPLVGRRLLEVLPGHGEPGGVFERFARVVETGEPHDMEFFYEGEGIRAWFRNMSVKLDDGVAMSFTDVTSRKSVEEALLQSEERQRTIVENLSEGLVACDIDGNLLQWNRAALEMHGFKSVNEGRRRLPDFGSIFELTDFDGEILPLQQWPLARLLRGEPLHDWEVRVRRLNSDWERVYSYGGTLVRDPAGKPLMGLLTITDVTERRRAQEALQALARTLEERVAERTVALERSHEALRQSERLATLGQAMAVLSHENRNAVQNCQASLQLLKRISEDPKQARYIEYALAAVNGLQHAYEDIRQYAAPMKLERAPASLARLWRETWAELEPRRTGRDARLLEAPGCVELDCEVDASRLKQVFRNIIENSLDACPDPVVITVACTQTELNGEPALRVSVRDNGPKVQEIEPARLMEAFYTTKAKGTGLGLAVVRRVVDAHGGRVEAGPAEEGGFEVTLVLPLRTA